MQSKWILEGNKNENWVKVWAPAKVNLFLRILKRLPSGYHEIQSLIVPITLADEIELTSGPRNKGIEIKCSNASIPLDQTNLVHKAIVALSRSGYLLRHVSVNIKKRIPAGAGLGGGSSDAAAVLKGIDWLYSLDLSREELCNIGLKIGSDIPFFFMEKACLVSGIGESLKPLKIAYDMWLVIGFPGFSISTEKVYQALDLELTNLKARVNMPFGLEGENEQYGGRWKLINDLEAPVFVWYPLLKGFCEKLRVLGALEARMTGSGSSIFGVFNEREAATTAMSEVQKQSPEWRFFLARPLWQGVDESWRKPNGSD